MIIRCEKCETKYRLDATMISTASVKVQCSKCAHVFIVPAAKDNHGSAEFQPDFSASPVTEDNKDLGAEIGSFNQPETGTEPGVEAEAGQDDAAPAGPDVKSVEETEAAPDTDVEAEPSHDFEMTFSASQEEQLNKSEAESHIEPEAAPDEPKPSLNDAASPEKPGSDLETDPYAEAPNEAIIEENTAEPGPSKASDIPTGTLEQDNSEDAADQSVADKVTTEDKEYSFEPYGSDKTETSLKAEGLSSNGNASSDAFDLSFNTPDKVSPGDGETSREFLTYETATDEPLAKFYVDKPSPEPEEDLELRERLKEHKREEELSADVSGGELSFNDELLRAEKADNKAPETEKESSREAEPSVAAPVKPITGGAKKSGGAGIIAVIVIILVLAGGLIYIKTRPESALMVPPSMEQTIKIESTKGYYVLNKDSGRIFVIESVIKNITEGPVKISGIRGLVFDSSGHEIASKEVAPGRIVNATDLRTMPVDRLMRSFRDNSEGTIPKKAVIPTMILFPELNEAVAEYGIDVLR
ncbi:MAG: zinc-ribbon domain-containing protein [Thermodesulfobacteriota bacterium]